MSGSGSATPKPPSPPTTAGIPQAEQRFFSKRAREIQAEEGIAPPTPGAYRPPALRGSSPPAPTPSPPGSTGAGAPASAAATIPLLRRPRAGTLPSNLQRYIAPGLSPSTATSGATTPAESVTGAGAPPPGLGARPGLRHSHSSNAFGSSNDRTSRLRSGSLTLPPSSGLSTDSAFGSSFFYSRSSHLPTLPDELRSVTSNESMPTDDSYLRTLDYLGLDDPPSVPHSPPQPVPSLDDLRRQFALSPTRMRANTLSTTKADPFRPTRLSYPLAPPSPAQSNSSLPDQDESVYAQAYPSLNGIAKGFKAAAHLSSSRPRAISVGILDEPPALHPPARSGVPFPDPAPSSSLELEPQPVVRAAPEGQAGQVPTRSLWIGGLDQGTTAQELMHVFAPYGAIESLRLLTDKECGFVNFVEKSDAMRARDDVLNRLGGRIPNSSGGSNLVRIGFGKIDSAPAPPAPAHGAAGMYDPSGAAAPAQGGLGPMEQPTRALWIGSIPSTTTPGTLLTIFSPYGPIESARVLTHKNCGFVNFERLDDAVRARKALNGREILGSETGAVRVGFAKVPVRPTAGAADDYAAAAGVSSPATVNALRAIQGTAAAGVPVEQQVLGGQVENYRSNLVLGLAGAGAHEGVLEVGEAQRPSVNDLQLIMHILSEGSPDLEVDVRSVSEIRPPATYYSTIPAVADRGAQRRFDASKLREIRKRLDAPTCAVDEVDALAQDCLDDIVDLASDYIGNTIVQKQFERCSTGVKIAMLEKLAPHLAMIGCHKNGTWAAQKIIDCATTPDEVALITQHLRPYTPPLLLDQFGNYVTQCCLRFGGLANEFIFDAMVDRIWDVAQGRFGARSMRAILESSHILPRQQKRIATAIILNSIPLATNPNGALLLTWLLDTSGLPGRYGLLAPRLAPHASHLITHKLASLTVLRIVNQRAEPEASQTLLRAIFESPNDQVLEDALNDQIHGVGVVQKLLSSPYLDPTQRAGYADAIKRVLTNFKVTSVAAYRRLLEEVGLPVSALPVTAPQGGGASPAVIPSLANATVTGYGVPPAPGAQDANLASLMASMQLQMQAATLNGGTTPELAHAMRAGMLPAGVPPSMDPLGQSQYRQAMPQDGTYSSRLSRGNSRRGGGPNSRAPRDYGSSNYSPQAVHAAAAYSPAPTHAQGVVAPPVHLNAQLFQAYQQAAQAGGYPYGGGYQQ